MIISWMWFFEETSNAKVVCFKVLETSAGIESRTAIEYFPRSAGQYAGGPFASGGWVKVQDSACRVTSWYVYNHGEMIIAI